jgi:VanZ family protein
MGLKKYIPALAWLLLSFVLLTLPGSSFTGYSWLDKIQVDKIVHIALFGMLCFLFYLPTGLSKLSAIAKKNRILQISIACLCYGIAMEFVQKYWVPLRSFDVYDIVADAVGSFLPTVLLGNKYLPKFITKIGFKK